MEVFVEPDPEAGAGEVLGVEVGFDEEFETPCCWAGPVDVEGDDFARTYSDGCWGVGFYVWGCGIVRIPVCSCL